MSTNDTEKQRPQEESGVSAGPRLPEFSIWWPQTKQGSDLWKLLLAVAAGVGALREYLSQRHFDFDDDAGALLISIAAAAGAWYVVLVVVRYAGYWFSQNLRR